MIAIAWSRREELNLKHCRPWLIATARNLLSDEYRARRRSIPTEPNALAKVDPRQEPDFEVESLDPELGRALDLLSPSDREAILLVAWEELTPAEAARSMGIRPATFRSRLTAPVAAWQRRSTSALPDRPKLQRVPWRTPYE
ncbi:MAG: sigma-70 family RNA polymerase sigma factor [Piscinibacter sp.]